MCPIQLGGLRKTLQAEPDPQSLNSLWISLADHQSLQAVHESQERDRSLGDVAPNIGAIVVACLEIEEV